MKAESSECADLGHRQRSSKIEPQHDAGVNGGLINLLIEQGRREEEIIQRMKAAVQKQDKDAVFELAKELVGHA